MTSSLFPKQNSRIFGGPPHLVACIENKSFTFSLQRILSFYTYRKAYVFNKAGINYTTGLHNSHSWGGMQSSLLTLPGICVHTGGEGVNLHSHTHTHTHTDTHSIISANCRCCVFALNTEAWDKTNVNIHVSQAQQDYLATYSYLDYQQTHTQTVWGYCNTRSTQTPGHGLTFTE